MRVWATAFPVLVLGAASLVVARLAGARVSWVWVGAAGVVLVLGAVTGAALAALAFSRRQLWWGLLLLLAWPVTAPLYVLRLRPRASGEAEV